MEQRETWPPAFPTVIPTLAQLCFFFLEPGHPVSCQENLSLILCRATRIQKHSWPLEVGMILDLAFLTLDLVASTPDKDETTNE